MKKILRNNKIQKYISKFFKIFKHYLNKLENKLKKKIVSHAGRSKGAITVKGKSSGGTRHFCPLIPNNYKRKSQRSFILFLFPPKKFIRNASTLYWRISQKEIIK